MRIRPCIDIHQGRVKQIVGSTLKDDGTGHPRENFVSDRPPEWFALLFKEKGLTGGHVIKLGPGNDEAAREALAAWPGGLQVGGGITAENAASWLEAGASHVIVTSYIFYHGVLDLDRLHRLVSEVGREHIVLDLSCRWRDGSYFIVTDRWQRFTSVAICQDVLDDLSQFCDEFLVHGVDVEGKCSGVDLELVSLLADSVEIPCTYAGGARDIRDALLVREKGRDRLDLTIGSALDIFGGTGVTLDEVVEFNRRYGP